MNDAGWEIYSTIQLNLAGALSFTPSMPLGENASFEAKGRASGVGLSVRIIRPIALRLYPIASF